MSTKTTFEIVSDSLEATETLGASIGRKLLGGEVFELVSDLGGGKTAFVRGLAAGIGATDVSSPSYTITNVYDGTSLQLYHYDFYRLQEPGIVADELHEALELPDTIVVVEWGQRVHNVLPEGRIIITIEPSSEDGRKFHFSVPQNYIYIRELIA